MSRGSTSEPLPAFRPDVEVLHQAAPGRPERRVLRDPFSGEVLEISDKEAFICERLDGRTPEATIRDQFRAFFGLDLRREHFLAFVRQLHDNGLLATSTGVADASPWQAMRPLWTGTDAAFRRCARALRGFFSGPLLLLYGVIALLAALLLAEYGDRIAHEIALFPTTLQAIAQPGGFPPSVLLRVFLILVALPFLRELVKGTVCTLRGLRVPEVRFEWYMRIIPRCASDVSHIFRLERGDRIRVVASGIVFELVLLAAAILVWEIVQPDNPVKSIAFSVAIAAAVSLLFNGSPLGQQDGGMLMALWVNEIDFRRRAVRMWRAWLCREHAPEAMEEGRRRRFVLYGVLADAWTVVINLAVLGMVGYLLTGWLDGFGAALFGILLMLRFEEPLRGIVSGRAGATRMTDNAKGRSMKWLPWIVAAVILVLLFIVPYPYEVGGEFRVQSSQQREVRSDIDGQIESIPVAEGAQVKAGDVIVQLSQRALQRDLEITRAALRREEEILKRLEAGTRPEEIAVAEQRVALAKTSSDHSIREYERAKDLFDKQHITPDEYETAVKRRDVDQQALALATSDLQLLKAGARAEDIAAQRAEVDKLGITLRHLEDDLSRTTIRAPIDGQVTTLFLQGKVGQRVGVGDVVAVIQDTSRTVIRIAVPEQYAGDIAVDATLRARSWAHPGTVLKGRVTGVAATFVGKSEDVMKQAAIEQEGGMVRNLDMPQQNVLPVIAEIDDPDGLLRSDMTGYAKVASGWRSVGYAFLNPVLRFFQVRVWSWIP